MDLRMTIDTKDGRELYLNMQGNDVRKIIKNDPTKLIKPCPKCKINVWDGMDTSYKLLMLLLSLCAPVIEPFQIVDKTEYAAFDWTVWKVHAWKLVIAFVVLFTTSHLTRYNL
eukprot:15396_1